MHWKFWKKRPQSAPTSWQPRQQPLASAALQFAQRKKEILAWRDQHEAKVYEILAIETPLFMRELRELIEETSHKDFFLYQRRWLADTINPRIQEWAEKQAINILQPASKEALAIAQARGGVKPVDHSLAADKSFLQLGDLATAIGPMAAGVISIPATVSASVVSAGGLMGLLGATAIAWPVVIGGSVLFGLSMVFGGYRLANFRKRAEKRRYRKLSKLVNRQVFGPLEDQLCLCEALQDIIRETAREQIQVGSA